MYNARVSQEEETVESMSFPLLNVFFSRRVLILELSHHRDESLSVVRFREVFLSRSLPVSPSQPIELIVAMKNDRELSTVDGQQTWPIVISKWLAESESQ